MAEVDKEDGALTWDFGRYKDMKTAAMKRLMRDLLRIENDPPPRVSATPQDDDISWKAVVCGPNFAPWEGATFKLTIQLTEKCPFTPPVFTKMDVWTLDVIWDLWNPVFDVTEMLLSVQCLLSNPDLNDPANDEAAKMLIEYISRVRKTVEKSSESVA